MKQVLIYTDGACLGNPGSGGWGAILQLKGTEIRREIAGGFRLTTNNRMEITAALEALAALKEPCQVELYTDSRYLCDSVEKGWLYNWQQKGFLKKNKEPVPNSDLWKRLLKLLQIHPTSLHWVPGHTGHPENERCDQMARMFAQKPDLPPDQPYEILKASSPEYLPLA